MWLPKNERAVLKNYYLEICKKQGKIGSAPTKVIWYSKDESLDSFLCKNDVESIDEEFIGDHYNREKSKKTIKKCLSVRAALDAANAVLRERNLIEIRPHLNQEDRIG